MTLNEAQRPLKETIASKASKRLKDHSKRNGQRGSMRRLKDLSKRRARFKEFF
tara:strand:- start:161 stop:319 length:159 start_codon:yes stop_codon:yes gene_type:complete